MAITLYQINLELQQAIWQAMDADTGEITDWAAIEALTIERNEKLEGYAIIIKQMKAEALAFAYEEARLKGERESLLKRSKQLEDRLAAELNGQNFKTMKAAVTFRKSQAVDVPDVKLLPKAYLRYKDPEADKTAIREALKAGKKVRGASLVERISMNVK